MVLVLTQGCLKTPSMIALLYQAALIEACLVPVLAEDSFRFPSAESFEELHREVTRALEGGGRPGESRAGRVELAAWGQLVFSAHRPALRATIQRSAPGGTSHRGPEEDQGLSDPSDLSRRRRTTGTPG